MARTYDVLVLGAGVVGVSTALHLQKRGKRVALIDRRGPGEETSYGNSGAIEASSILPYAFPKASQIKDILLDRDSSARTDLKHLDKVLPFVLRLRRETTMARRLASARSLRPLLDHVIGEHKDLHAAVRRPALPARAGLDSRLPLPEGLRRRSRRSATSPRISRSLSRR